MWKEIEERAIKNGEYIVAMGCTVRACADALGASKSTVHKDVTERLSRIDHDLYIRVKNILEKNLSERHIRGGESTRLKYCKGRAPSPPASS